MPKTKIQYTAYKQPVVEALTEYKDAIDNPSLYRWLTSTDQSHSKLTNELLESAKTPDPDILFLNEVIEGASKIDSKVSQLRDRVGTVALSQTVNYAAGVLETLELLYIIMALYNRHYGSLGAGMMVCGLTDLLEKHIQRSISKGFMKGVESITNLPHDIKKINLATIKEFINHSSLGDAVSTAAHVVSNINKFAYSNYVFFKNLGDAKVDKVNETQNRPMFSLYNK